MSHKRVTYALKLVKQKSKQSSMIDQTLKSFENEAIKQEELGQNKKAILIYSKLINYISDCFYTLQNPDVFNPLENEDDTNLEELLKIEPVFRRCFIDDDWTKKCFLYIKKITEETNSLNTLINLFYLQTGNLSKIHGLQTHTSLHSNEPLEDYLMVTYFLNLYKLKLNNEYLVKAKGHITHMLQYKSDAKDNEEIQLKIIETLVNSIYIDIILKTNKEVIKDIDKFTKIFKKYLATNTKNKDRILDLINVLFQYKSHVLVGLRKYCSCLSCIDQILDINKEANSSPKHIQLLLLKKVFVSQKAENLNVFEECVYSLHSLLKTSKALRNFYSLCTKIRDVPPKDIKTRIILYYEIRFYKTCLRLVNSYLYPSVNQPKIIIDLDETQAKLHSIIEQLLLNYIKTKTTIIKHRQTLLIAVYYIYKLLKTCNTSTHGFDICSVIVIIESIIENTQTSKRIRKNIHKILNYTNKLHANSRRLKLSNVKRNQFKTVQVVFEPLFLIKKIGFKIFSNKLSSLGNHELSDNNVSVSDDNIYECICTNITSYINSFICTLYLNIKLYLLPISPTTGTLQTNYPVDKALFLFLYKKHQNITILVNVTIKEDSFTEEAFSSITEPVFNKYSDSIRALIQKQWLAQLVGDTSPKALLSSSIAHTTLKGLGLPSEIAEKILQLSFIFIKKSKENKTNPLAFYFKALDVSGNLLDDRFIYFFCKTRHLYLNLEKIDLSNNLIADLGLRHMIDCGDTLSRNLKELAIAYNPKITSLDLILELIDRFENMTLLDISGIPFDFLSPTSHFPQTENGYKLSLIIQDSVIGRENIKSFVLFIEKISKARKLDSVDVSYSSLNGLLVSDLVHLISSYTNKILMRHLDLEKHLESSHKSHVAITPCELPECYLSLDMSYCNIAMSDLEKVLQTIKKRKIQELSFEGNNLIKDECIASLSTLREIKKLNMKYCDISVDGAEKLIEWSTEAGIIQVEL